LSLPFAEWGNGIAEPEYHRCPPIFFISKKRIKKIKAIKIGSRKSNKKAEGGRRKAE
jgi:hypothetical protein